MSYNITKWKTKTIENLIIPLSSFYVRKRTDWHPDAPVIVDLETMTVLIVGGYELELTGILKDGMLTVTKFNMSGDGSGTFFGRILIPALKQSTGYLEAILVWEGGDSIEHLICDNGIITKQSL